MPWLADLMNYGNFESPSLDKIPDESIEMPMFLLPRSLPSTTTFFCFIKTLKQFLTW